MRYSASPQTTLKITIIGDAAVGKTALMETYISSVFPEEHHPTTFDTHEATIVVQDKAISLQLWEVGSLVSDPMLRQQAFYGTDVFMIVYSVAETPTLDAVNNWLEDLQQFRVDASIPQIRVVLVGNKEDLRSDPEVQKQLQQINASFVTKKMVQEKEFPIDAHFFVSAKTAENVKELFDRAIELGAESFL